MIRFAFIIFFTCTGFAFAQTEEEDKGYIVSLLEENLSGDDHTITINGFEGALSSEASIAQLTIADKDGIWFELQGASLVWTRSALLRGAVEIDQLSAEKITISRSPSSATEAPSPEATVFALPELPISINLGLLDIKQIALSEAFLGEPINVAVTGTAALSGGEGSANIVAARLDERAGRFEIDGSYSNETNVLGLDLALTEDAGGIIARLLDLPGQPSVTLDLTGTGPISDYAADIQLSTEGAERVTGAFTVKTVEADTAFSLDLNGDVTPLFAPEYQSFFGTDLRLASNGLLTENGVVSLRDLSLSAQHIQLDGRAEISAEGWPELIALTGRVADPSGASVLLPLAGPKTYVSAMDLNIGFNAAQSDVWQGRFDINKFQRPGLEIETLNVGGSGYIAATTGRIIADVAYAANGITLDNSAAADALGQDITGNLSISKAPDTDIEVEELTLAGAGLSMGATATIKGAVSGFETQGSVLGEVAALERFQTLLNQPIKGSASLALVGSLRPLDGIFDVLISGATTNLAIGIAEVDRLTKGDGTMSARVARDTSGTLVEALKVETDAAIITGDAQLNSKGGIADIAAEIRDVSRVVPELAGAAFLQAGAIIDEQGEIAFDIGATARDASLTAIGTVEQSPDRRVVIADVTADLNNLQSYAGVIGRPLSGSLSATLKGRLSDNPIVAEGRITAQTQNLAIGDATVDKLLAGAGELNAGFTRSGAHIAINDLALATPNLAVNADLDTAHNVGLGQFNARLRDIGLFTDVASGPVTATGTTERRLTDWQFEIDANGPAGIRATSRGEYDDNGQLNAQLNGNAPLGLANGALDPRRLSGLVNFDLAINGPPALSSVSGRVTTNGARLADPGLAQAIEDIDGVVNIASGSAQLDFSGSVKSGGQISIAGPVALTAPYQSGIGIQLANVILRDPTLYESTVNGQIGANGPLANGAAISGALTLGATEVRVPSSGVSALGDLPEIRHIGESATVRQTLNRAGAMGTQNTAENRSSGPSFPLDIVINAPSRIFVRGRGLDAELGGSLTLGGTTSNIQPVGRFDLIRGRLDILQQRFNLTEGSATLQGDFEPHLRLIAQTEAATGTIIRIIVEGPASEPEVRFESSPELPQDEVLSQLIFGRDISEISPLQAVQLASAVGTLAGRGGGGVIDNFRQGLGLDDFDVTTDDAGNAAVRAGAYISENVYTDVTVSSDGSTEINLNLDITNDITAKGSVDADGETSIGIFFERDY